MKINPARKRCRKRQFATHREAWEWIKGHPAFDGCRPYKCPYCYGRPIHIGHPEGR